MFIKNILQRADSKEIQSYITNGEIKLIVFDMHGTITNRLSVHPYHIAYRNKYIKDHSGINLKPFKIVSTDEAFDLVPNLDKKNFYNYRDHDIKFKFSKVHKPNAELGVLINKLKENYITVLYSDSTFKQIDRTLNAIGIQNCFDKIISNENGCNKRQNSFNTYIKLCSQYDVSMSSLLMIGDRMDKDIQPVINLNGNAIYVQSEKFINNAIKQFINLNASDNSICA